MDHQKNPSQSGNKSVEPRDLASLTAEEQMQVGHLTDQELAEATEMAGVLLETTPAEVTATQATGEVQITPSSFPEIEPQSVLVSSQLPEARPEVRQPALPAPSRSRPASSLQVSAAKKGRFKPPTMPKAPPLSEKDRRLIDEMASKKVPPSQTTGEFFSAGLEGVLSRARGANASLQQPPEALAYAETSSVAPKAPTRYLQIQVVATQCVPIQQQALPPANIPVSATHLLGALLAAAMPAIYNLGNQLILSAWQVLFHFFNNERAREENSQMGGGVKGVPPLPKPNRTARKKPDTSNAQIMPTQLDFACGAGLPFDQQTSPSSLPVPLSPLGPQLPGTAPAQANASSLPVALGPLGPQLPGAAFTQGAGTSPAAPLGSLGAQNSLVAATQPTAHSPVSLESDEVLPPSDGPAGHHMRDSAA